MNNNLASDFLSENPATCISCENPSRVKKYHYKGMTPEQIALIRQAQVAQTQDKKVILPLARPYSDAAAIRSGHV